MQVSGGQNVSVSALEPSESMQVLHAVDMVVSLIEPSFDEDLEIHVRRACRESFAMNARALVGFLVKPDPRDIDALDYLGQAFDPGPDRDALDDLFNWASVHVAHFGRDARAAEPVVELSPQDLVTRAETIVRAMLRFVDALSDHEHGEAERYRVHLDAAATGLGAVRERLVPS